MRIHRTKNSAPPSPNADLNATKAALSTNPRSLRKLAHTPGGVHKAAANPHTPSDVLFKLSQDPLLHPYLAQNPRCPPRLLRLILQQAKSASPQHLQMCIRHLEQNPNTPSDVLTQLPPSPHTLSHPNAPAKLLQQAATQGDLALYVAAHRKTPKSTLQQLSTHPSALVRYEVALNRNTPTATLEQLSHDPESSVQEAAREGLAFQELLKAHTKV